MERHGRTVLRVCRVVAGPDAEDAWSETFLSALRAYPDLPDNSNVEAWLVTIAHRKAIDQYRARRRRAEPVATPPDGVAGDRASARLELCEALAELPDKQRSAVAFHHVAGLPHAEVAAILGGSPEAARKAASDGIARLRSLYRGALS